MEKTGNYMICLVCGTTKYTSPSGSKRKLCSMKCYGSYRKKLFKLNPEMGEAIRKRQTNKKQSVETIEKRVSKIRGIKRPDWVIEKLKLKSRKGKESHFWKGGVSSFSYRLRRSPNFKKWREKIFSRDDWTCVFCFKRGMELHPDHIVPLSVILREIFKITPLITYEELYSKKELWDISNGRTLCAPCHRKTPSYGVNDFNSIK